MCRHVVYWGPPISPAALVLDAPNSLLKQCTAAREMSWGCDNLDGWGMAWHAGDGWRHTRSARALTEDAAGQEHLRSERSGRFVVHVRQKTPGSATDERNSAPFHDGVRRFFTHNGYVEGFRAGVREQLLAEVSPARFDGIRGDTDSEVLFALVLGRLDDGATPVEALGAVADVAAVHGGRYNVVLYDGDTVAATRWDNSLYVLDDDAAIISSEPLDARPWRVVPERTIVVVDHDGTRQEAM